MPINLQALLSMSPHDQLAAIHHAEQEFGIVNRGGDQRGFLNPAHVRNSDLAMDALPDLITVSNSGIPAYLTNYTDPRVIEILVTPMKAAQIYGEQKRGDWTTLTTIFPVAESAGEVSTYGDHAVNGEVSANINWPQRQSYTYQTIQQWGERELEMAGKASIDWATRLNTSAALVMNKFQNKTYLLGVQGLQNYGMMNDAALSAPIAPTPKAAGGFAWSVNGNQNATALEVVSDVDKLVERLIAQTGGIAALDSAMKLVMSPTRSVGLTYTTTFGISASDMLKKKYPSMVFETIPEFSTASGELMQLIMSNIEGQETGFCAFTEKMRAHNIVVEMSAWKQKKSGGTWGWIGTSPIGIVQGIGY